MKRVFAPTLVAVAAVSAASVVVPSSALADRSATTRERQQLAVTLSNELDKTLSRSCLQARVSTVSRRWASQSFTNSRSCIRKGQAGDGFGVYRRVSGGWRYIGAGPCDTGYKIAGVPSRVFRDLRGGQCRG